MSAFTGRNRFVSMKSLWRHFKNSKTTRNAYLCLDLSIHFKNILIHLITQSLYQEQIFTEYFQKIKQPILVQIYLFSIISIRLFYLVLYDIRVQYALNLSPQLEQVLIILHRWFLYTRTCTYRALISSTLQNIKLLQT